MSVIRTRIALLVALELLAGDLEAVGRGRLPPCLEDRDSNCRSPDSPSRPRPRLALALDDDASRTRVPEAACPAAGSAAAQETDSRLPSEGGRQATGRISFDDPAVGDPHRRPASRRGPSSIECGPQIQFVESGAQTMPIPSQTARIALIGLVRSESRWERPWPGARESPCSEQPIRRPRKPEPPSPACSTARSRGSP